MTTIHQDIQVYLANNGRSTTGQMANALGYETRQVREASKELEADSQIQGSKSKRIPAYIINGDYVVVTERREQLLKLVKKYARQDLSKAQNMSDDALQNFVRKRIADRVVGGPKIYEFWV